MADILTPEQRHRCMAAIKGRDTKPEMLVRRYLFAKGLRYRVNNRKLPGTPDLVLKKYRTVIFVDGCFWHGHEGCRYYRLPKSNTPFWQAKIDRNRNRDICNDAELRDLGWRVIRIWECDIRTKATRDVALERLYRRITTPASHYYPPRPTLAAEPEAEYGISEPQL